MNKIRVGVLMGGRSIEREVSFNSGRTICDHLDTCKYTIVPLFQRFDGTLFLLPWHFLHRGKIDDFLNRLETEAQTISWDDLKQTIDFMYIATHGRYAEDGTLQGFLEVLNIPYLGSKVFASALCMDKVIQKQILANNNISVPNGFVVYPSDFANKKKLSLFLEEQLKKKDLRLPVIVKPAHEGSSLGVTLVTNKKELANAVVTAGTVNAEKPQTVLVEEQINGMEFSCIIITDYKTGKLMPLPPTEIVPETPDKIFDYTQKYMPGRATKFTPPRCNTKTISAIHETCTKVMRLFQMNNLARIDGFVTQDNRIVIVDPNSLSGMGPASFFFREAAEIGMGHTAIINHLIETELHSYGLINTDINNNQTNENTMTAKKFRVGVLMGGNTNEREVSLESGRNISYKLSPHKYESISLFVDETMQLFQLPQSLLVRNSTKEIQNLITNDMRVAWSNLPKLVDFIFIGLHGGNGENGSVQGTLEMLQIPYNGSGVLASSICMDKYKTAQLLNAHNIPTPKSKLITKQQWKNEKEKTIKTIVEEIKLPTIIKPHNDGCSVMVHKASTKEELTQSIENVLQQTKELVLVEELVTGMELTVGVVGNETAKALPPSQAVAAHGILSIEEKFLPGAGQNLTPAPLSESATKFVQQTVETAYKAVDCTGYARIDCFYQDAQTSPIGKERCVILEINSLPGMTPATCIFHQAAELGIRPMEFIDLIVSLGLAKHKESNPQLLKKFFNEKMKRLNGFKAVVSHTSP